MHSNKYQQRALPLAIITAVSSTASLVWGAGQTDGVLELSDLNGLNGFVLSGVSSFDYSGTSVSDAGDVNGDGIDDLIIGSSGADPNGESSGETYVVFGQTNNFAANFQLSDLNGNNGFKLSGIASFDFAGAAISSAGDFNGDGIDDLIIGASGAEPNSINSGASYLFFGSSEPMAASIDLSSLNGQNGFALNGADTDFAGVDVSGAGDFNHDGFDDVIIGAPGRNSVGASYIIFGNSDMITSNFELSSLSSSNGILLNGVSVADSAGRAVSDAGDVNGDGISDVIIGAFRANTNANNSGASYVVFGSSEGLLASIDLSGLNGSNGFTLNGISTRDYSGISVGKAGDFNGDGFDDFIIGAIGANPNGVISGATYLVFGSAGSMSSSLELSDLNGINGFAINGSMAYSYGSVVSSAGDINADGLSDIMISSAGANPNGGNSGAVHIVFGSNNAMPASIELSSLDGTDGFVLNGVAPGDVTGSSLSLAGDVNGNGVVDLLIGAPFASTNDNVLSGTTYVIYGLPDTIFEADFEN